MAKALAKAKSRVMHILASLSTKNWCHKIVDSLLYELRAVETIFTWTLCLLSEQVD